MVDANTASDTASESFDDDLSEEMSNVSAERQRRIFIVGQPPRTFSPKNQKHILHKLYTREIKGCIKQHNNAPNEKLFNYIPLWRYLPLLQLIPLSALQAGHIIMGMTQCGQFILTYTCSLDLRSTGSLYKYLLHWWVYTPKRIAKKVSEVTLFGNYTISKELDVVVAQWPMERNKIVIHGLNSDWGQSQATDRGYLTITTVPSLGNCKECAKVAASYEEEELAANSAWDGCARCNCLIHGLTVHTTYEVISPYPKFRAEVCLNYWNHVVINTGNFLHVLKVDLKIPNKRKNLCTNDKQDGIMPDIRLTSDPSLSDIEELDDSRTECYDSLESSFELSPGQESTNEREFIDDNNRKIDDLNNSCINKIGDTNGSEKYCDCLNSTSANGVDCDCSTKMLNSNNNISERGISVRDKILQDFCDDLSQELSIGNDTITLVKHPSCSPRSTPQRLPTDLKQAWFNLTPPSDILRTRSNDSSHGNGKIINTNSSSSSSSSSSNNNSSTSTSSNNNNNNNKRPASPQPGTSSDVNLTNLTSINSPLHTLSISPQPCSPRLMSPPMTTSLRQYHHLSPRKRANLHSPPPPPAARNRSTTTHKLTLEAEKAYEFTDESHETCEKLSSFRKRRLADKKYEFREEAEDIENIIPFKHIRDQSELRNHCSVHRLQRSVSPAYTSNDKWHRIDSENSEGEDNTTNQDIFYIYKPIESDLSDTKYILRPLSQNRLYKLTPWHGRLHSRFDSVSNNYSTLSSRSFVPHPVIKCTAHYKRSYIEVDDEMLSVITEVEDDETGGYVSYQCVLPMNVHGSGYVQMQMISNCKAEKLMLPYISISQLSFDIETFTHHIADWICKRFKKIYWHCNDYDIEIINVCGITGDVICLLMMKIHASENSMPRNCAQERNSYETGCTFSWNIQTNQYKITCILPILQKPVKQNRIESIHNLSESDVWNPTRGLIPYFRKRTHQIYARPVRFLQHSMAFSDSLTQIVDMDNLVSLYMTPLPDDAGPD